MKILTLNKEQKTKLLTLCKEFFPEYKDVRIRTYYSQGDYNFTPEHPNRKEETNDLFTVEFLTDKEEHQEHEDGVGYSVHWYQLCLTELSKRIFEALPEQAIEDSNYLSNNPVWEQVAMDIVNYQKHPVDFLFKMWEAAKREGYLK